MKYTIEDIKVTVGDVVIEGFALGDPVQVRPARLWYKDVVGKPFTVWATCEDYSMVEVPFTELGYEKHIKPMKPTVDSPFKCVVNHD